METIEYQRDSEFREKVLSEYEKGDLKVICPGCKEEMLIILNEEDVIKYQRSQGMYCPNDHIQVVFNVKG